MARVGRVKARRVRVGSVKGFLGVGRGCEGRGGGRSEEVVALVNSGYDAPADGPGRACEGFWGFGPRLATRGRRCSRLPVGP
ncbi:hypothetical protein [Thermofilum pendens]|uniref:hypothetical protein n=1 Tax=Thermofilum pendens TaxID=2269 RepID=UPI0011E53167|nr:hypothetical protein [Thermofilum pendens]